MTMLLILKSELDVITSSGKHDKLITNTIIDTEKLNDAEKINVVNQIIQATEAKMKRDDSKEDPTLRCRMISALS